jgi:hypothetical protein
MNDVPNDLLDARHACRLLRCHVSAVHRWRLAGRLRAWKRCGRWFFSEAECRALFRPGPGTPAAGPAPDPGRDHETAMSYLRARGYGV